MTAVLVEAPARLHWGMFDIAGTLGRQFGGLGVAVTHPAVRLTARLSAQLLATGPDSERVLAFARRYLESLGRPGGAEFQVEAAIPHHVGLGSGTKLALAVARALAALYEQPADPYTLAQQVGRGKRSAVGLWTFARGGLVVEGGRKPDENEPAPLLVRYPMPENWYCVLAIPEKFAGLSGSAEVAAFERLAPSADLSARISHLTLMSLLPALVEGDLTEFGAALTELQRLVGESFSPVQGGHFANPKTSALIEALLDWGATGVGQSSWGPAVYGLVDDPAQGRELVRRAANLLAGQGSVELVAFDNCGVRCQPQ